MSEGLKDFLFAVGGFIVGYIFEHWVNRPKLRP
jgi:hypothetical protein